MRHHAHAHQSEGGRGESIASMTSDDGRGVETDARHVCEGVDDADTATGTIRVGPVCEPGCRRGHHRDHTDAGQQVRGGLQVATADEIENGRARERPDGDVGEERMELDDRARCR